MSHDCARSGSEQRPEGLIELGIGLAFGQGGKQQRGRGGHAGEAVGIVEKAHGVGFHQLAVKRAEMLGQPPAPMRDDMIARLEQRAPARRLPAAH